MSSFVGPIKSPHITRVLTAGPYRTGMSISSDSANNSDRPSLGAVSMVCHSIAASQMVINVDGPATGKGQRYAFVVVSHNAASMNASASRQFGTTSHQVFGMVL